MKKVILVAALAGALAFSSVQAAPNVPQQDLNQIFTITSVTENNQLSILSTNEMRRTVGEGWFSDFFGDVFITDKCSWWVPFSCW